MGLLRFARAAVPLFGPGILRRWVGLAAVLAAAFAAALAAALAATFAAALNARLLGDVIGDRLETLIDGVELGLQPLLLRAVGRIADRPICSRRLAGRCDRFGLGSLASESDVPLVGHVGKPLDVGAAAADERLAGSILGRCGAHSATHLRVPA